MKKMRFWLFALTLAVLGSVAWGASPDKMVDRIHWYGQASLRIDAAPGKKVFIDPLLLKEKDSASVILITHSHEDHLSLDDLAKIIDKQTVVVAPQDCVATIEKRFPETKVKSVEPGVKMDLPGVKIEAVPAYNIVKTQFHAQEKKWVGYIVTVEGVKIYYAGDTERIPEMKQMTADIALVPLGQTYTVGSVKEATEVVMDVKAKIAIPVHYGLYEGKDEDAQEFARLLKDKVKVVIKDKD